MPLNEAGGYRRSTLTPEQQREAEGAFRGHQESNVVSPNASPDQIEYMRRFIADHDAKQSGGDVQFDLNNPPQKPYHYQPFPKTVYSADGQNRIVQNQAQLDQALANGWRTMPFTTDEEPQPEPDAFAAAEAQLKRGPGRPPKVQQPRPIEQ